MGTETPDAELIAASRRGDTAAFGVIVERYQRAVHAVSYSGTRDRALSDDIAQETFVTAWRGLAGLRDNDRLPAWLCGIARNLARAARRRRGSEIALEDRDLVTTHSPFDELSDHEADQMVATALERLPEKYREPMVLFYCEGQSTKVVARALGISEAATHQRLSRGRQHLIEGMPGLVQRTLQRLHPRGTLVAAVLVAISMVGVSSQVDASTTTTKGSGMFKQLGAALVITGALTGTAVLVQRSRAEPAASVSHETTPSTTIAGARLAGSNLPGTPAQAATSKALAAHDIAHGTATGAAPLACNTIARHIADLGMQAQPDLAEIPPSQLELDIRVLTEQMEAACTKQNWSTEYRACIAAATETFTVGIECARFAPSDVPRAATTRPQPPYAGDDVGCASVARHVVTLFQPDPQTLEKRDAIERARITMPEQVEAACDQNGWSELRRRCVLAATTIRDVETCR
jgi:RNA polymerase sigma factor (sigma-70 family)